MLVDDRSEARLAGGGVYSFPFFRGFPSPGSAPAKGSAAKRFAALSHSPATSAMAAGAMSFGVKSKTLIG